MHEVRKGALILMEQGVMVVEPLLQFLCSPVKPFTCMLGDHQAMGDIPLHSMVVGKDITIHHQCAVEWRAGEPQTYALEVPT
jgi:hypothetical protein